MKTTIAILALALAAPALAAPVKAPAKSGKAAAKLPVFEFKGLRSGEAVNMSLLTNCEQKEGSIECSMVDNVVAGEQTFISPSYTLADGKLSSMFLLFQERAFLTLASALTQKYGAPCKTETRKWQNKAGSSFDNPVMTWCFASGDLELHSMSVRRDYSHLEYQDRLVKPIVKGAPVDF